MKALKQALVFIYEFLLKIERGILVVSSLTVVAIICAAIFMRYILHTDLFAYDELVMIAAFWLYFIGAAYGSYEDSHIKADIIQISLSGSRPRAAAIIGLTAKGLEVIFSATISFWGWSLFAWQLKYMGRTMGWGIPIAVPQGAIVLGFTLMCLYAIVNFVKAALDFKAGYFSGTRTVGG